MKNVKNLLLALAIGTFGLQACGDSTETDTANADTTITTTEAGDMEMAEEGTTEGNTGTGESTNPGGNMSGGTSEPNGGNTGNMDNSSAQANKAGVPSVDENTGRYKGANDTPNNRDGVGTPSK